MGVRPEKVLKERKEIVNRLRNLGDKGNISMLSRVLRLPKPEEPIFKNKIP